MALGIVVFYLSGCSSLSFTRGERPFDGTVHAASSLVCSGYWSNHGYAGKEKGRKLSERVVPTVGLAIYSTVDLVSSFVTDVVTFPISVFGNGPRVASFDKVRLSSLSLSVEKLRFPILFVADPCILISKI